MRITKLLLICICCVIAVPAVWGQAANIQAKPGILGYLDPHTGAFRPIPPPADDAADLLPAFATFTGTINFTINVTVKSVGIANVVCSMEVSVFDGSGTINPRSFGESDSVLATGTGSARKCTLSIPYSWALATQSSDSFTTSYVVSGTSTATNALPNRSSSLFPYATTKVPSSGTTTTLLPAAVTI
jgi:hypothetical protein